MESDPSKKVTWPQWLTVIMVICLSLCNICLWYFALEGSKFMSDKMEMVNVEMKKMKGDIKQLKMEVGELTKSRTRVKRQSDADIEFINPKLRKEVDKLPEDPNNPWVWLTSYSRIPVEAMQDFCRASKEYCPPGKTGDPGPPGPRGEPGLRGKRGRAGFVGRKGDKGDKGDRGPPGPVGPQGEKGLRGPPGLHGRDGLPGEPGLDGVPGRNGLDGVPGIDGIPGLPGIAGTPGKPGIDGEKGDKGEEGPQGPMGERGLPGPRGKPGQDGKDGKVGNPGISLWTIDEKTMETLLIPPKISGGTEDEVKTIIVKEGDHLKLTCAASGIPKPQISWNRADGNAFPDGAWRKSNEIGSTLNITKINREHMGLYICEANNGIPPVAEQEFKVEVHFPPLIFVHRQVVGGYNGSFTLLECTIEAYPTAVNYWERHDGKILQQEEGKYKIASKEYDVYKTSLSLNVTLTEPADFGAYYCISKNEKGLTKAAITLFERDPNSALPPPLIGGYRPTVVGEKPPPFASFDDICPAKPKCPTCEVQRCEAAAKMYGLTVLPYDSSLPGLPNRTEECMVETIGKPVFHRYTGDLYGSWIIDAEDAEGEDGNKIWVTRSDHDRTLFEYRNKTVFRKDIPTRNYTLPFPFSGNDHVIFNGSLYYYCHDIESIVKYELTTRLNKRLPIPRNRITEQVQGPLVSTLYSPQQESSYVDFATDENGLWALFGMTTDNNTVVMKMDPYSLDLQYIWNISLKHSQVADTFIICGVLYAVDHVDERHTRIRFALDLYKNKLLDVELPFTNPFSFTTMLDYNPKIQSLITWDGGNQLTYPVKYHSIGYKEEPIKEEANSTGYEILEAEKGPGLELAQLFDDEDG